MSQVLCPVLALDHNNIITKNNIDSLLLSTYDRVPGTRVAVSCYVPDSFTLDGPSQVVCSSNGQWSPSVPSCVRRSSSNSGDNGNNKGNTGDGTTEDNGTSSTKSDDDTSILSDNGIIIIAAAAAFIVILIIIILILACKYYFGSSRRKEDDDTKELIRLPYNETPTTTTTTRPQVAIVAVDNMFSSPFQVQDVYTGPESPPSWHSHPIIVMAEEYKQRSWNQLSVDQYLRDMDASRRDNPNHSWRDFATLSLSSSSFYSRRSISSSLI